MIYTSIKKFHKVVYYFVEYLYNGNKKLLSFNNII